MTACPTCGHVTAIVLRSWETFIDAKVESANGYSINHGAARFAYAKKRDQWMMRWRVADWSGLDGKWSFRSSHLTTTVRRHVTFTRHYTGRQREMDAANMVGGMKGVVDAMVRVGLLVDDAPKWFEGTYLQLRSDRSGLHVRIEERQ